MLLNQIFENKIVEGLTRTGRNNTAVIGWGRGMGHIGHMYLASSVITQANESKADPYFVVSRTVGKDDPLTPAEKLSIYKRVFAEHKHIFQSTSDAAPDLNRIMSKLHEHGYKKVIVVLGEAEVAAFQYLKNYNGKPTKSGEVLYTFESIDVISRQQTNDPSRMLAGPRATDMRNILLDPNKLDEDKFAFWRDAMSPKLADDEVHMIMKLAEHRLKNLVEGSEGRCMQCGMKNCKCPGGSCKCKPIAGWIPNKGFQKAANQNVAESSDPFRSLLMALRQDAGQFVDTKGAMGGQRFLLNVNQRLAQLQGTGNPRSKVIANTVRDIVNDAQRSAVSTKGLSFGTLANTLMQLTQQELQKINQQGVAESEKKGLYYYVNKRKKAGTSRPASSPKAPTAQAWKDAAKTAKKESVESDVEIRNYNKLDKILEKLSEMVIKGQESEKDYGMVAAAVLDPDNQIVARLNRPGRDGKRVHAEHAAMLAYTDKYGPIPEGSIVITTCSPCNEQMDERDGPSCTDLINNSTVKKVYCGYMDPTQGNDTRQFNLLETANNELRDICKQFADTFLDHIDENFADGRNPQDKGDAKRHGINTKASVSSLRKTAHQGGRKGQLAHWLANMKAGRAKNEGLTLDEQFDLIEEMVEQVAAEFGVDPEIIWEDFDAVDDETLLESAAWHRKAGKSKTGGLNAKGIASYRRENPGSHLQKAVTTKPSKLKPGSKAAKRRKSFCARMGGNKGPMKKPNGDPTRKALALRKWNCHEGIERNISEEAEDNGPYEYVVHYNNPKTGTFGSRTVKTTQPAPKSDSPGAKKFFGKWTGHYQAHEKRSDTDNRSHHVVTKSEKKTESRVVPVDESIEIQMAKLIKILEDKK